jgi:hypothetical protein
MLPEEAPGRAHHDLGGVSGYLCEAIDKTPHELTPFDREVDALRQVLTAKGLLPVDALRRGVESLPPELYDSASYYERWLYSSIAILLEKGVVTEAELRVGLAA